MNVLFYVAAQVQKTRLQDHADSHCEKIRRDEFQSKHTVTAVFLDPEGASQKATLVVILVVTSSLKIPKAFLVRSAAQRNFAYTFVLIFSTDLHSQILKLICNY